MQTINRYNVGKDGRTPYEVIRGNRCNLAVAKFGELVHYKKRAPEGDKKNKGEVNWEDGIFLGMADRSNEYIIGGM